MKRTVRSTGNDPAVVLITGVGSNTAISVIKGLRQQRDFPVRIVGVDSNPARTIAGSSMCDAFEQIPLARDATYIPMLLRICERERVQVLIPIIDPELKVIAHHATRFTEHNVRLLLSDERVIDICNDKYETYRYFVAHDIPTPQSWLPDELPHDLPYPLIVKPREGVSSRDVFTVRSEAELHAAIDRVDRPIIQEYLEGKEYTIDTMSDLDGKVRAVVPRERISTKAGISTRGVTVRDEPLIAYGRSIAEGLPIRGHSNIQCRVVNGVPKFFEINPRFSGTLVLTIAAGVNSPSLLVQHALGKPWDRAYYDFRENVYMARYWQEVFTNGSEG